MKRLCLILILFHLILPAPVQATPTEANMDSYDDLNNAYVLYASAPLHQRDAWREAFNRYQRERGAQRAAIPYLANGVSAHGIGDGMAHMLPIPLIHQEKRHWCGPATAGMASCASGNSKISISSLADALQTDEGGTDFGEGSNWLVVLEKGTGFHYRILNGPSNGGNTQGWPQTFFHHACATLLCNRVPILDTVQYVSGLRLPGYERYLHDTWHYLALTGFDATDPKRPMIFYNDPNGFNSEAFGMHALPADDLAEATSFGMLY